MGKLRSITLDVLAMFFFLKLLLKTSATRSRESKPKESEVRSHSPPDLVDIETKFSNGGTALHLAAGEGHDELLNLLLASNTNPAAINNNGATALHLAVVNGKLESVKALMAKMDALTVGTKNSDGDTALHLACRGTSESIVEEFLTEESPMSHDTVTEKNANNKTPMSIAVQERALKILQLLVNYEADIKYSEEGDTKWATMEDTSHDVVVIGELLDSKESWEHEKGAREGNPGQNTLLGRSQRLQAFGGEDTSN